MKAQAKVAEAQERKEESARPRHADATASGRRDFFGTERSAEPAPTLEVGANAYQVQMASGKLSELDKRLKSINGTLNKMSPEKYDALCQRLLTEHDVLGDMEVLQQTVPLIFTRAISQNDLCNVFADLCSLFAKKLQEKQETAEQAKNFRRLLLSAVQKEYEGIKGKSDEEVPKKKRLGISQFVGELYIKGLLNLRVMQVILGELLYGVYPPPEDANKHRPSESDLEVLCKLLATSGSVLDKDPSGKTFVTEYLTTLVKFSKDPKFGARIRFLLLGTAELREKGWPDTNAKAKTLSEQEQADLQREEAKLYGDRKDTNFTGENTAWGKAAEITVPVVKPDSKPQQHNKPHDDKDGGGKKKKKNKKK
eukprot:TRINITY_DN1418_c0_g1_i1.p1 TRINITY_DN1418_c0_g1~~TRINITY_DN1418_c0_g1_i1.p1  ORF type:complete len:401 (+),score=153.42 TRINITY_DN1418_c0_g1_i1:105-1205(+)